MPISDEFKKTLTDPTPLYALAGAGDLAYEKLREVPAQLEALAADRKGTQERAAAALQDAGAALAGAQAKVTEAVNALPTDVKELQAKAQEFAMQQVGRALEFAVKAKEVYDELAVRGRTVVDTANAPKDGEPQASAEADAPVEEVVVEEVVIAEVVVDEEPAAPKSAAKKAPRPRKSAAADQE
ncbi:hypothetical protein K353_02728 [Kitasatospora sp. SolWspMP-SS2h]|uniref:hypothetical protein n=1 Tax=Kitasatospora sp. SolWspMP-SS2h TaxID=1305729 RepID=UPI000DBA2CB9|nr:hypothetical protein [Kitasatospora sp. SolWspMP-SS2h]RAJ42375.1 hypothetical protein K353_02728 [Kitasatospora sp. SolWspMP-SS2h]